ncbi:MAG TPA: peptide chain release factor 3 [Vicinamibacterales bacterium]|nr:peptide chain release factor 3 [Vicinamibacterales bacterium]
MQTAITASTLKFEVDRRRTFAIISHPDAGKTTLTEKLLLYAGAIELAGAVRGRKTDRHVVSDWMDIERERGISVTSAAVEFDLGPHHLTLLDTPGHKDFSEDTYRTLFAVDGVVMVIDAAKGIESQTRKLFEVCKLRRLPVLTFINKLDLPSRDPFDLLDEIERVLGIHAVPMNWPIGSGDRFRGVFDLQNGTVHLYDRKERAHPAPVNVGAANDPRVAALVGEDAWQHLVDETSLVTGAGTTFDHQAYLDFRHTPVFFGSALSNFGLEPFLYALTELAPPPRGRESDQGVIAPDTPHFTAFVFKIQANMNKRHRDRVAFLRVCSGVFEKDMVIVNARAGQEIRAARPYRFFGGKRETIEKAFPGDVVGLVNPGQFGIGDTLYAGLPVKYPPIPRFPAEHFGVARLRDVRFKQFDEAIRQLEEEGLMQVLFPTIGRREPILGTVGPLQLEVLAVRLKDEYNVDADVDSLNYTAARWLIGPADKISSMQMSLSGARSVTDRQGRPVMLFESEWALDYAQRTYPDVKFLAFHAD